MTLCLEFKRISPDHISTKLNIISYCYCNSVVQAIGRLKAITTEVPMCQTLIALCSLGRRGPGKRKRWTLLVVSSPDGSEQAKGLLRNIRLNPQKPNSIK